MYDADGSIPGPTHDMENDGNTQTETDHPELAQTAEDVEESKKKAQELAEKKEVQECMQ